MTLCQLTLACVRHEEDEVIVIEDLTVGGKIGGNGVWEEETHCL